MNGHQAAGRLVPRPAPVPLVPLTTRLPLVAVFAALAAVTAARPVAAQSADKPKDKPSDVPTFGIATELVYVRFHVERKGGSFVDQVSRDQLRVLEDGRPQTIALLEMPSTRERSIPPEVTLAFDVSGSVMDPRLLDETLIKEVFVATLSEQTSVGLCAFGGELRCFAPPTRDVRALLEAFGQAMQFGREMRRQGTRLYDSLVDICKEMSQGARSQRALVVFSDGLDNRDGKVQDAIRAAAEADARVYAVKLSQSFQAANQDLRGGLGGATPNRSLYDYKKFDLDKLAAESGGRAYEPGTVDKKSVADILRAIASQISMEFIVGYQPADPASGKKRRVKVELADKSLGSIKDGERTLVR